MARKPAQTKAEDKARDATDATEDRITAAAGDDQGAVDTGAAGNTDTEGGNGAASAADTPDHAQGADVPGQTGGEEGSDLPAGHYKGSERPFTIKSFDGLSAEAQPIVPAGTDINVANPAWIVTCHREGGRRRAGRRWPKGETHVPAGELAAYDLAILNGDPRFSVRPADRN
ncbi:hypothetical protein F8A10_12155 [Paracoccus kondratievae]|uniref:hypothetical protein n=1 Tax=Paracoccus kondratievae TaxID=135740 RepID=UPI0012660D56|nr:hypothetical protein [Paracoccus kondratievae]QFQ88263.1 hypothetical protein F8A10_12155 [Paracoccus kondratievae]